MSEVIPTGWSAALLSEICNFAIGGTPSRIVPEYWDTKKTAGKPWVSIRDLSSRLLVETSEYITELGIENSNVKLVKKGTILMSFKLSVGRVAIAGRDLYTNEAIAAFIPKPDAKLSNGFLYHGLQHWNLLENTDQAVKGVTLNKEKIGLIEALLPPLPEQQKIATILSSVDDVIEKTRAQIDKLKDLKTGMMQELLTQGIGHTEFKDSPVGRIPASWRAAQFDNLCILQRGFDLPVQNRNFGEVPVLGSNGVVGYHDTAQVFGPCVVTGRSGSIGEVVYFERDTWPLNTTLYVRDFFGNDRKYVYYFLTYFNLARFGTGTGVPTLNRNDVHLNMIAIPQPNEQKKIAILLSEKDKLISVMKQKLESLKNLKKALMQDLLTGKVRVKVATAETATA